MAAHLMLKSKLGKCTEKELDAFIEKLEKDNTEMANIEKQHKYMNGELHKEVAKLNKEIFEVKKDNAIFKEHLQAELLKKK